MGAPPLKIRPSRFFFKNTAGLLFSANTNSALHPAWASARSSSLTMGNLKKKRRLKMNKHKRRKRLKANRHKKRTWQK